MKHPWVLGFLLAAAPACNGKKADVDSKTSESKSPATESATPEGNKAPDAKKAPAKPALRGPGLQLLESVGAWKLSDGPRYFGPDNLYDLINGGSEVYIAYGLKEMAVAEFRAADTPNAAVTVEVYDLGSPLNAFGRFSKFLDGKTDPASAAEGVPGAVAGRGMLGSGSASFWKGGFLVNLTLLDESPDATLESTKALGTKVLPAFMAALDAHISGSVELPADLAAFPEANQQKMSYLYEPALWRIDALSAGFAAGYVDGGKAWQLFVTTPFADAAAADKALKAADGDLGLRNIVAAVEGARIVGYRTGGDKPAVSAAQKSLKALQTALKAASK